MYRFILAVFGVLALASCISAGDQIATATSMGYFNLRGATVLPDQGVPAWPVMSGDVIIAGDLPVTVTFSDGSTVTLDATSKGEIVMSGGIPTFELDTGAAEYSLKSLVAVRLMALNQSFTPPGLHGRYAFNVKGIAVALPAAQSPKAVAFFGAALVAGVLGVGLWKSMSGGSSVSPSD